MPCTWRRHQCWEESQRLSGGPHLGFLCEQGKYLGMGFSHSLLHARGLLWCLTHVSGIELNCTLAWGQEEESYQEGKFRAWRMISVFSQFAHLVTSEQREQMTLCFPSFTD